MARPWWQRLSRKTTPVPSPPADRPLFEFDDRGVPGGRPWRSGGWWLRAESKPVKVGLFAAAKATPTLLRAWTFNTPEQKSIEKPLIRGHDRLAELYGWGLEFAA
jgi:hypothetical protein